MMMAIIKAGRRKPSGGEGDLLLGQCRLKAAKAKFFMCKYRAVFILLFSFKKMDIYFNISGCHRVNIPVRAAFTEAKMLLFPSLNSVMKPMKYD